ncbi:MAG: TetR/AcrR family transcriptional regulator [Pseudomonadota bacterium]
MATATRKKSRQDNQRERREALISAGLKVVARHGYTKASVNRITNAAGLAQGTLYSYFGSHEKFLNQLLPEEGMRFFRFLDQNAAETGDYFEDQRLRFLAISRYLQRNRYFLRVMTDAECAVPESYAQHMSNVEERYLRDQYAAQAAGQIRPFDDTEHRVIAEIQAGAVGHIALGFGGRPAETGSGIPEWAADTYVRFFRDGLASRMADLSQVPVPGDRTVFRPQFHGTRERLLEAAARVVMARGFSGTNVASIAQEAGLSVGALYKHFDSQQELFDLLIDHVRVAMLDHVREFTHGAKTFVEREYRGFHAFFDFLTTSPWYIRVESEAAVWTPKTYNRHFFDLADSYVILLRRAQASGELEGYEDRELPVLAYILMAARHYIAARYVPADGSARHLPPHVVSTYLALLQRGMSLHNDL